MPLRRMLTIAVCAMWILTGCIDDEIDGGVVDAEDTEERAEQAEETIPVTGIDRIVIAGKPFTEQHILVDMLSILLQEKLDIDTLALKDFGPTTDIHAALLQGEVDIYIEYTGTAYLNVLNEDLEALDRRRLVADLRQAYAENFDLAVLPPFSFENTFALTVSRSLAEELDLLSNSDLSIYAPTLVFTSDSDFFERVDGYDALNDVYGFVWAREIDISPDLMYMSLVNGDTDVITGFSTDPRIIEYDLVILEDDLQFFPPYEAIPIMRSEILEEIPDIEQWLQVIGNALTNEKMTQLNARVNLTRKPSEDVARQFLLDLQLVDPSS